MKTFKYLLALTLCFALGGALAKANQDDLINVGKETAELRAMQVEVQIALIEFRETENFLAGVSDAIDHAVPESDEPIVALAGR